MEYMVIAYLRVSTGKQHLENQKSEINRYVSNKQLVINRWIEETVSGKTDKNERRLGNLIKNLRTGDTVIITEISRLSRSLHEIMVIMKHCVDMGVIIHSTKDGYIFDDSLNSKVLSFAFGLAAEIEHKLISQRTKEALAMRKLEGKHIGRKYGSDYTYQSALKRKSEILSDIENGLTISKICKKSAFSRIIFEKLRKNCSKIDIAMKNRNILKGNRWKDKL